MKELKGHVERVASHEGEIHIPSALGGTNDYEKFKNKPSINEVELMGDKSFEELGVTTLTNSELKDMIDAQFDTIFGGA